MSATLPTDTWYHYYGTQYTNELHGLSYIRNTDWHQRLSGAMLQIQCKCHVTLLTFPIPLPLQYMMWLTHYHDHSIFCMFLTHRCRPPRCWGISSHYYRCHQITPNFWLGWLWVQAHHTPGLPASWCWQVSTSYRGQCSWTVPVSQQSPVGQQCLLDTSSSLVSIPTSADSRDTALCQDNQLHQALICESTLLPGESALHIQAA